MNEGTVRKRDKETKESKGGRTARRGKGTIHSGQARIDRGETTRRKQADEGTGRRTNRKAKERKNKTRERQRHETRAMAFIEAIEGKGSRKLGKNLKVLS